MATYHYLAASLEELNLDRPLLENKLSTQELFLFCMQEMIPADFDQVRTLFLFNDIKNCVFFTFFDKERKEDFSSPSYYDEKTFFELRTNPGSFLPFLAKYHELKAANQRIWPQLPETDELTCLFYEDLHTLTKPGFLRDYLTFLCNLRNIASALAFRKSSMPIASKLVPWGMAFELVREFETSPLFGLEREFSYVQHLQQTLETGSQLEFELSIDKILWDWLYEQLPADFFSLDAILAYFIRLASVERWQKLTVQAGQAVLDDIMNTAQRSIRFSLEFNKTGDR